MTKVNEQARQKATTYGRKTVEIFIIYKRV